MTRGSHSVPARLLLAATVAAVLLVCQVRTALAQNVEEVDVEEMTEMSLEELLGLEISVAVASLFDQSSLEAPSTVALIRRADWERRGVRQTIEALQNQPGVMIVPTLFGGHAVIIRGYASAGSARGVGLVLDGVPMNEVEFGSGFYWLNDIASPTLDRIEMVRGPGSAVYGSDAFHGVVSMRSYSSDEDEYVAGAELGTDLWHRFYLRASQELGIEGLRFEAAAGYHRLPEFEEEYDYSFTTDPSDPAATISGTGTRDRGFQNGRVMARLRYEADDVPVDGSVVFHAMVTRPEQGVGIGAAGAGGGDAGLLRDNDFTFSSVDHLMVRPQVGVDLPGDLRIEVMGYWWGQEGSAGSSFLIPPNPLLADPIPVGQIHQVVDFDRYGTRATIQQDLDVIDTRWMLGYEFSRASRDSPDTFITANTVAGPADLCLDTTLRDPDMGCPTAGAWNRKIHSLFLSAQTHFADDTIRLHYGGRLDWFQDSALNGAPGLIAGGAPPASADNFQASPRLGLVAMPTEEMAIKALYGRAFRPAVGGERFGANPILGSPDLDPEIIDTLELVFEMQRDEWRFNVTGFGSLWDDAIAPQPLAAPDPVTGLSVQYQNSQQNRAIGVETLFTYARTDFRIDFSGSYIRSENETLGLEYEAFPRYIVNLGGGYTFLDGRLDTYLFFRLEADRTARPPTPSAPDPETLDPYLHTSFNASWWAVEDHLKLFLNVRNFLALDNQYPSIWGSDDPIDDYPINASIGLQGQF